MRTRIDDWSPAASAFGDGRDFDCATNFDAPCDGHIQFDGIATIAEVRIDGRTVATSRSMWVPLRIPITAGTHHIEVRCAALEPLLTTSRGPRARWRQSLGAPGNLRWFRTSLIGRAPGLFSGEPMVGLWRPAWFVADEPVLNIRTRVVADTGVVSLRSNVPDGTPVAVGGATSSFHDGMAEVSIPNVERWWPHSYGTPALYDVEIDGAVRRRIGFRTIESPGDIRRDGLRPRVNGVDIFVRGAVWTPTDPKDVRSTLEAARDHGLNAIRVPGTSTYESDHFYDLCSELGLMVWQDLMFANFDYPFDDPDFRSIVDAELDALMARLRGQPSLFCLCGGSEVEQQAEMLGQEIGLARHPLFESEIPARLEAEGIDALWIPNAPCGAERALRSDDGVSNWYAIGGYRRPLTEARRTPLKFASECLAMANVGDALSDPDSAEWKQGVPRDPGADWHFDDVRNHYLRDIFCCDPDELRDADPALWLELSKEVSARIMAEVFGEWRRPDHPSAGGFVMRLRDDRPGPGWGLIDSDGRPKRALRGLADVIAPVAMWITDEGTDGYLVHVANDRPAPLTGDLSVSVMRSGKSLYCASQPVTVAPRGHVALDAERVLGRWVDVSYAYRFGPPAHDEVRAELTLDGQSTPLVARRFPVKGRAFA